MAGDGQGSTEHPRRRPHPRTPCSRSFSRAVSAAGRLLVVGCAAATADPGTDGPPPVPSEVVDRIDRADVVFTVGEAEPTVLFYAEAWRVELLDGVAEADGSHLAAWFAAHPGATAVLVAPGDPGPVTTAARALLPELRIERLDGPGLSPPWRYPLGWASE
ncbi:hypothetical protein [Pseudonocardia sp. N23]|uniref:hypothetical protein n=1 Tax=Pseudonocardia sp. N23 TaxID=1987376 RepID=UPI000BFB43EF|nr:hypothetical protein [Pseudonocardia sp. N23]